MESNYTLFELKHDIELNHFSDFTRHLQSEGWTIVGVISDVPAEIVIFVCKKEKE